MPSKQERAPARASAEQLAELIRGSECTVALSGAGISVPSGIPDFRTPGEGFWEKVDPMSVATIDAFHRDTQRFWEFYRPRFHALSDKRPNPAHEALAELERRGLLDAVITQNIDLLHRKAGSERVIEVHGSIATASCTSCDGERSSSSGWSRCSTTEGIATCTSLRREGQAGRGAVRGAPARGRDGRRPRAGAPGPIFCSASARRWRSIPVAGLPGLTLASGGRIAIVTKSSTPYDSDAAVRLERGRGRGAGDRAAALD